MLGGDVIVGLVARQLDAGQVEGARRVADRRELRDEVLRRLLPVRLVLRIDVVAEGLGRGVEDDRDGVGVALAQQLHQHVGEAERSEEHTSELQSLMRISYAVFCLKTKRHHKTIYLNLSTTHKFCKPTISHIS